MQKSNTHFTQNSNCGTKKEDLKLSDREWICECGAIHDRDINAAINIERYMSTVSSTGFQACGEASAGSPAIGGVKLASTKQEPGRV